MAKILQRIVDAFESEGNPELSVEQIAWRVHRKNVHRKNVNYIRKIVKGSGLFFMRKTFVDGRRRRVFMYSLLPQAMGFSGLRPRKFDCATYDSCLATAARKNVGSFCDGCANYQRDEGFARRDAQCCRNLVLHWAKIWAKESPEEFRQWIFSDDV